MRANGSYGSTDGITQSTSATFSEDPYLYTTDPLSTNAVSMMNDKGLAVNLHQNASFNYGKNKNAWSMLQLYRRLNARGRNITLRVEGSVGDNQQHQFLCNATCQIPS